MKPCSNLLEQKVAESNKSNYYNMQSTVIERFLLNP